MNQTNYNLPEAIQQQQYHYLHMKNGLFQLFDKFDSLRLFQITQDPVQVNLDNITFGPAHHSITFTSKQDLSFKIIYYCILYQIFERTYDDRSTKAYTNLLSYIFKNQIHSQQLKLTQQQIKIYLVKFLHILETAKIRRKVVFEQLNSLPQISILLVLLIKQIVKQQKLIFQKNARRIEKFILDELQLQFDLLSYQLFLFAGQFKVEIRQFDKNCSFMIFHDKPQQIKRIKDQFYLGESAYFIQQDKKQSYGNFDISVSMRKISVKIIKKSTMKSIQWSEDQFQRLNDPQQSTKMDFMKQSEEEQCSSFIQDNRQITKEVPWISIQNNEQQEKIPNLNEIVKAASKQKDQHVNTRTRYLNHKDNYDTKLIHYSANNTYVPRHKNHKQSFDSTHLSAFYFNKKQLTACKSTKQIKNECFEEGKQKILRKQRRVPSFVLNRMKKKQLKNHNVQQQKTSDTFMANFPKITFNYKFA